MEWTKCLREAITYMENHLLEDITGEDVADAVFMSSFYLQKGFKILTGYTPTEYLKCRRLYLAGLDVLAGNERVIDLAYKYGYDTPESFSKAFARFHGCSPAQLRRSPGCIQTFLPLRVKISIKGGYEMDYTVEKMSGFKIIGFERKFAYDTTYQEIPGFWGEFAEKYLQPLCSGQKVPETDAEKIICACNVGRYGVCIDNCSEEGKLLYLIAGDYHGEPVPEGMTVFEFPEMEWAKFRCTGPMPDAIQAVNTKIFQEWLPENPEFEPAMGANIEEYCEGDTSAPDYESAVWIPVKRK